MTRLSTMLDRLADMFDDHVRRGQPVLIDLDLMGNFAHVMRHGAAEARQLEAAARERDELQEIARDLDVIGKAKLKVSTEIGGLMDLAAQMKREDAAARGANVVVFPVVARPRPIDPSNSGDAA